MDNTWASPLYFKPFEHGVDVSIQAATKYIVGHADAMLGAITGNERAAPIMLDETQSIGICAGTEEVYLGMRGIRTIEVRLERHWRSGLDIARWLEQRPEVSRVLHPALESDPGHALWKRDFLGASGLFAFELKPVPKKAVAAMLDGLQLFGMGASWGGFESLVLPFNATALSHRHQVADGGTNRARPHRPRGCRRPQGRSRCRFRTPEISELIYSAFGACYCAVMPPSMTSSEPVTQDNSSEARNNTPLAMSSAVPSRPIGVRSISTCRTAGSLKRCSVSGVSA